MLSKYLLTECVTKEDQKEMLQLTTGSQSAVMWSQKFHFCP